MKKATRGLFSPQCSYSHSARKPHGGNEGVIFPQGIQYGYFSLFLWLAAQRYVSESSAALRMGHFGKSGLQGLPTRVALPLPSRDIQLLLSLSVGLLGPPIHNMGLCSRPGEDPNAWKQFGPDYSWVSSGSPDPGSRLGSNGFWVGDYGGGVRVGRPFPR